MEGQELVDYLIETYGDCEVMENGTLHVKVVDKTWKSVNDIYFPSTITEDMQLVTYIPGQNAPHTPGSVEARAELAERAGSVEGGQLGYVLAVSSMSEDEANIAQVATNTIVDCGGNVKHNEIVGFSAGADYCILHSNDYAANNPDVDVDIVIADGAFSKFTTIMYKDLTPLKERNASITMIGSSKTLNLVSGDYKDGSVASFAKALSRKKEMNVKVITTNDDNHQVINKGLIANLLPYITGDSDSIGDFHISEMLPDYQFYNYNGETGFFDTTVEPVFLKMNKNQTQSDIRLTWLMNFSKIEPSAESNLGSMERTTINYLNSEMASLHSLVTRSDCFQQSSGLGGGELATAVSNATSAYNNSSRDFYLDILSTEKKLMQTGATMIGLDQDQAGKGSNL